MKTQSFENILYDYRYNSSSDRFSGSMDPHFLNFQRNLSGFENPKIKENNEAVNQILARVFCLAAIVAIFYLVSLFF